MFPRDVAGSVMGQVRAPHGDEAKRKDHDRRRENNITQKS